MEIKVFTKMSGTGNDFLFFDARSQYAQDQLASIFGPLTRSEIAKLLCHRTEGIGADGLVFIDLAKDPHLKVDFAWDFFNADGSFAEMCGNAARCVGRYAVERCGISSPMTFLTGAGPVESMVREKGIVAVTMPQVSSGKKPLIDGIEPFLSVNTGVPHLVITLDSPPDIESWRPKARTIRQHQCFQPEGTNVTLVWKIADNEIGSVSYERGVEDFTLACGTGAVAAAYSFVQHQRTSTEIRVKLPGGELVVDLSGPKPLLVGPTKFIADIEINPDILASNKGEK